MSVANTSTNNNSPIVGIDLGTTNSVVAAIIQGRVRVLAEEGEPLLPSVVGLDLAGKLIIGQAARNGQVAFPDRTIASVKRRMGEAVTLPLGDQQFTPPEVSAMILRRLRDRAEKALGVPVTRAVITVPAFFDEHQRQATREAGSLAGLTVERIINEPTAATLVYRGGSENREHLVVYDLGGGTFDVSVVRLERGVVEVLSSRGDTRLGGDDFDQLLVDHVAEQFLDAHDIDLRDKPQTRWRLIHACEQAKRRLSDEYAVRVSEEFIAEVDGQPVNLDVEITRPEYEDLIQPLIDRTIGCVDAALRDANLSLNQVDQFLLVGGSTRTPLVQNRLREEFHREPQRTVDPDLAVALGAATQAAMLDGIDVGPVLVDVTTHTLGIEVLDSFSLSGPRLVFSPIIHRNSPLPAKYEHAYMTVYDGQKEAEIHVLQGEHHEVARNRSIGRFMLELDASRSAGNAIVVRFELTLDGTLKVTAVERATGTTKVLRIENALSKFQDSERPLAEARLASMFADSDEIGGEALSGSFLDESDEIHPAQMSHPHFSLGASSGASERQGELPEDAPPEAVRLLHRAESLAGSSLSGDDAQEIANLARQLRGALVESDASLIAELCQELDDILFYVQG